MTQRRVPRACVACGVTRSPTDAPDPCLGMLPGVAFACCGHGNERKCYVVEEPVTGFVGWDDCPRGQAAWERMRELGGDPAPLTRNDRRNDGWRKAEVAS